MDNQIVQSRGPTGTIDDADFIARHLLAAIQSDGYLEVVLGNGLESHACLLLSDPLDQVSRVAGEQPYAGSYLRDRTHLLVSPLEPEVNVAALAACDKILLHFWDHLSGLEAEVRYLGEGECHGLPAHRLSFPRQLVKHKNRHTLRARLLGGMSMQASLRLEDGRIVTFPVWDLHEQGLSLTWNDSSLPAEGQTVTVKLATASAPLVLEGVVRFLGSGLSGKRRCGVAFHPLAADSPDYQQLRQLVIHVDEYGQLHLRRRFARYFEVEFTTSS